MVSGNPNRGGVASQPDGDSEGDADADGRAPPERWPSGSWLASLKARFTRVLPCCVSRAQATVLPFESASSAASNLPWAWSISTRIRFTGEPFGCSPPPELLPPPSVLGGGNERS